MKIMIASDIHGSAYYCKKMFEAFERESADRLVLLGDILYHGPRNDLPRDYDPKEVIKMLNAAADRLLCVRGNCDTEVDQMVLNFPILADYAVIYIGDRMMYMSHGHKFGADNPPPLSRGDILMCGHTHVPKISEQDGYTYLNPGSVSIPKEDSAHSYMTFENNMFLWKNLNGREYMDFTV